jgi:hypothetical protein
VKAEFNKNFYFRLAWPSAYGGIMADDKTLTDFFVRFLRESST